MWSFGSRMGSHEPRNKINMMPKGGYHTSFLIGPCFNPLVDKQFDYRKNVANVNPTPKQSYEISTKMDEIEEKPKKQEPITINNPEVQSRLCNNHNKKKKKKRRRRRKKSQAKTGPQQTQPKKQRQRQVSTAESEDSFVIFFDNDRDHSDDDTESGDFSSWESIVPRKKVRFVEDDKLCEVHPMIAWSFAYQDARRGPWEEYARDRCRFRIRIQQMEPVLGHVFTAEHRSKIYQQRFS